MEEKSIKTLIRERKEKDSRYNRLSITCLVCSRVFIVAQYRKHSSKYCNSDCQSVAKKGRRFSTSTEFKKGVRTSISTEFKKGHTLTPAGAGHFNWKGGVVSVRKKDCKTSEYKEWRSEVFKRDDYTCRRCGVRGGRLEADHIKMLSTHPWLRYELHNGQTLCIKCHREKTKVDMLIHHAINKELKKLVREGVIEMKEVGVGGYTCYQYHLKK